MYATAILSIAWALWVIGCAEPVADRQAYIAVPPDFGLSVTVVGPDRSDAWLALTADQRKDVPESSLSARFIVEADGTLRTATGPGATDELYPGQTRTLVRSQMLELWRTVRNHGLLTAEQSHGVKNPAMVMPSPGATTHVFSIYALGDRITIAIQADEPSRIGEGSRRLIRLLRDLSWLTTD